MSISNLPCTSKRMNVDLSAVFPRSGIDMTPSDPSVSIQPTASKIRTDLFALVGRVMAHLSKLWTFGVSST